MMAASGEYTFEFLGNYAQEPQQASADEYALNTPANEKSVAESDHDVENRNVENIPPRLPVASKPEARPSSQIPKLDTIGPKTLSAALTALAKWKEPVRPTETIFKRSVESNAPPSEEEEEEQEELDTETESMAEERERQWKREQEEKDSSKKRVRFMDEDDEEEDDDDDEDEDEEEEEEEESPPPKNYDSDFEDSKVDVIPEAKVRDNPYEAQQRARASVVSEKGMDVMICALFPYCGFYTQIAQKSYEDMEKVFQFRTAYAGYKRTYHLFSDQQLVDDTIWSSSVGFKGLGKGQAPAQLKPGETWSYKERSFGLPRGRLTGRFAGTLFHSGMEHHHGMYPPEIDRAFKENPHILQEVEYVRDRVLQESAITDREINLSSVPYCFPGRSDLLLQDADGLTYIADHKRSSETYKLVKSLKRITRPPDGLFRPGFTDMGEYVEEVNGGVVLDYIMQLAFYHVLYRMKFDTPYVSKYAVIIVVKPQDEDYLSGMKPKVHAIFFDLTRPVTVKTKVNDKLVPKRFPVLVWVHDAICRNMLKKMLQQRKLKVETMEEGIRKLKDMQVKVATSIKGMLTGTSKMDKSKQDPLLHVLKQSIR
jgi:hypothetical protein